VGAFLDEVFRTTTSRTTVEGYAVAFRKIVSDIFDLSTNQKKYDYSSGGLNGWLAVSNTFYGPLASAYFSGFVEPLAR
jgi:predicted ATPase